MYGLVLTLGLTAAVNAFDHGPSYNFEVESLVNHTFYQPMISGLGKGNLKLPVIVWGNGGCSKCMCPLGLRFRAFHNEIASHGAFIIANGVSYIDEDEVVQEEDDPSLPPASDQAPEDLTAAIDWVYENAGKGEYRHVDRTRIGVWGQSCGGLEAYGAGALDDRVHHLGIFNSGVVPGSPVPVDVSLIKKPVFYIIGGEDELAYPNAEVDYAALPEGTPAWKAQHSFGHSGGFAGPNGSIGAVAGKHMLQWLLRGEPNAKDWFTGEGSTNDGFYDVVHKNLDAINVKPIGGKGSACKA